MSVEPVFPDDIDTIFKWIEILHAKIRQKYQASAPQRCKTCRHWELHPPNAYPGPGTTGSCHVLKIDRPFMPFYTTHESFGCVRWEGLEDK